MATQYSCLENPMARGAWWATVHRVAKSQTQLRRLSTHACTVEVNTILNQLHFNKINLKYYLGTQKRQRHYY